jgi:hypothetical protein
MLTREEARAGQAVPAAVRDGEHPPLFCGGARRHRPKGYRA